MTKPIGFKPDSTSNLLDQGIVASVASRALAMLASEVGGTAEGKSGMELESFCEALIASDENARHEATARLIARGVKSERILDEYIPHAARLLGQWWVEDRIRFYDVTIGSARLQEMSRSLGSRVGAVGTIIPLGHRVLMVVPESEDHCLGAFTAASQLRRYGLWVHMALNMTDEEVAYQVSQTKFCMIGLSGTGARSVRNLTSLVSHIRAVDETVPIVIGGNVVNLDVDLKKATKADLITSNPREAVDFCDLTVMTEPQLLQP